MGRMPFHVVSSSKQQTVSTKERRKTLIHLINWFAVLGLYLTWPLKWATAKDNKQFQRSDMKLPPPETKGTISVERAIIQRRTIRAYRSQNLLLNQLSQLLWAAQGITESNGIKRAAPSAGALYPLDLFAVVGQDSVERLETGVYHYKSERHCLSLVVGRDLLNRVARAALSQMWMAKAPLYIVITAEYSRTTGKYGKRGVRYALIEAGHVGQNIFLQAEALGLKAGIVGAFNDSKLIEIMKIPHSYEPLLIMPVGYAA